MIYGVLILTISFILAIIVRKTNKTDSCLIKKLLPFLIMLSGGIIGSFVTYLNT